MLPTNAAEVAAGVGTPSTTVADDTSSGDTGALGRVQTINYVNAAAPAATSTTTTTIPQIDAPIQYPIGIVPPIDPSCH